MRKRAEQNSFANDISWMVSFSDVITLLITFFVLIISMSSMDDKTIKKSMTYFSGSPGMFGNEHPGSKNFIYFKKKYKLSEKDFIRILKIISTYQVTEIKALSLLKLEHIVGINNNYTLEGNNVKIHIKGNDIFTDFDFKINSKGYLFLNNLVKLSNNFNGLIKIEIFTTKFPVSTPSIKNNVDLSLKRGDRIATYLSNRGISKERIAVIGWGYNKLAKDLINITLKDYLKI